MTHVRRIAALLVVALVASLVTTTVGFASDKFPTKPIQIVVPFSAGGSTDLLARAVEKVWTKYCPQPVVIVNKPTGGGVVGTEFVVRSKADGYTLYLGYGSGHDLVMPHLQKLPYDTFGDLVPVCRLSIHSVLVAVPANSQFKTLRELIAWAKSNNKPVTAAVSTAAGAVDIVMRAIGKVAGINIVTVPHAGGSQAVTTLIGGHVMLGGGHPSEIMPYVESGKLRVLAVALPERDPALPNIPTLKEEGVDIYTWGSVKGVAAPAGTPREVIDYLAGVFKKVCEDPEFKKTMADLLQPIMYQGPDEFGAFMKKAFKDYGELIKELNITL